MKTGSMMREGWHRRMLREDHLKSRVVSRARMSWGKYRMERPIRMEVRGVTFSVSTN